jgi:cysteine desulfurase/selenocysteine lyase
MIHLKTARRHHALTQDFPILRRTVNGRRLVYLDSAATSQRPVQVVEAMNAYYQSYNANVHRGVYAISEEATAAYEGARGRVARFIGASSPREVIFVRNATEAINLVAYSWGRANVGAGDLIVTTEMEHHSNFVPWQLLAQEKGARLGVVGIDEQGTLRMDQLRELLAQRPKLVAFTAVSNALGTVNPTEEIVALAKAAGAVVLVDGAQSVPHRPTNVREMGADFLAFSGHKMLGPTGIGVLWGRRQLLEAMPPFMSGGDMIRSVAVEGSTWNDLPWKFEAGTPAIAEGIGLGRAVEYLEEIGMAAVERQEQELVAYTLERLARIKGLKVLGPDVGQRAGIVSFLMEGIHPHDMASLLDREGVAVRAGHHCCQPLMRCLGVPATTRVSFYVYNTLADVDRLAEAIETSRKVFGV